MGKPWFHPKRYGYGSGLPCSPEGWVVLTLFLLVAVGGRAGLAMAGLGERPDLMALVLGADVLALVVICAVKTRGGWRWRWGDDD